MDRSELLDRAGVASLLGVSAETVSRYRRVYGPGHRNPFPGPDRVVAGRHPQWVAGRVLDWDAARPGQDGVRARPNGSPVRDRRVAAALTQPDLAARTGLSQGRISEIERGERPVTRADARVLARALRCRMTDLLPPVEVTVA